MQYVVRSGVYIGKQQTIKVESREYGPQHRTIKTNVGNKYYSLPSLQFSRHDQFYDNYKPHFYFYTITTVDDGQLRTINLPNIAGGMVCLGVATENRFSTSIHLTLDEFIDLFWFTTFNGLLYFEGGVLPQEIGFCKIANRLPSLWMNEEYNLKIGWVKV